MDRSQSHTSPPNEYFKMFIIFQIEKHILKCYGTVHVYRTYNTDHNNMFTNIYNYAKALCVFSATTRGIILITASHEVVNFLDVGLYYVYSNA